MPPLDEGDLLYMPTTFPGISVTKGSMMIRTADPRPNVWVYVDIKDLDVGTDVKKGKARGGEERQVAGGIQ